MSSFSQGKHALAISDRSGLAFPYNEMVREWNGALVHNSEYEPKQPQLQPKPTNADPQALQRARPARTEFPTEDFLPENPFTTASNTTLKVAFPFGQLQVNDQVTFRNVKQTVGGVFIGYIQLNASLNFDINSTQTTISLKGLAETQFPRSGFVVIEKINSETGLYENEVVEYTGMTGDELTGCIRGTSAPYRGVSPEKTKASEHLATAKVLGSYKVVSLNETSVPSVGQPSTTTQFDGINITLNNAAPSTETGGGFQCTIGPVNDRA